MRRRNGFILLGLGIVLAAMAGYMVLSATRAATTRAETLVQVVVATEDIPELSAVPSTALTVRNAPPEVVPQGEIASPEEAIGKFTTTKIFKDQIIMAPQLSAVKVIGNLSASVPVGKVAMAFPASDLMGASGAIRAGDRMDILLTLQLPAKGTAAGENQGNDQGTGMSVQNTVQNVEVLAVSWENQQQKTEGAFTPKSSSGGTITLLLDHQTALVVKGVRDSGGVVDLVLRSPEDSKEVPTDGVTLDSLVEQFKFRMPNVIE